MKIVVIGAAGFIGRTFVELAAARGHDVIAGVRRPEAVQFSSTVTVMRVDATEQSDIDRALIGSECVVNCVMGPGKTMIAASGAICESALRYHVRRALHMSSIAVYGCVKGIVGEDAELCATDHYGTAKIECERIVAAAKLRGLDAVVLRPALVYGPNSPLWVTRIARLLKAHRLGNLGALGVGFCNLVHVRVVAAAMLAALEREALGYSVYNISSAKPPTWNAYLTYFAGCLGVTPVPHIPRWRMKIERIVVAPVLRICEIIAKRFGKADLIPPPITPGLSSLFCAPVLYDSARIAEILPESDVSWTTHVDAIAALLKQPDTDKG